MKRALLMLLGICMAVMISACQKAETQSVFGEKIQGDESGYQIKDCEWNLSKEEVENVFSDEKLEAGLDNGLYSGMYKTEEGEYQYCYYFSEDETPVMNRFMVYYHCDSQEDYQKLCSRIAKEAKEHLPGSDETSASLGQLEKGGQDVTVYWEGKDKSNVQIYTQQGQWVLYIQVAAPMQS